MAFESLTDRLAGVFKKLRGHGKLTEADIKAAMREVRMALLEADVNYKVAKDFCARVSERAMGQEVMESLTPAQQVVKIVNEELVALMGGEEAPRLIVKNKGQTIIMLCGLQGNGKTTHAAKLAKYFIKQGRRPMLVACDIYRPAAIDQLQVVGGQAGAPVFTLPGAKPPEIARKALAHAKDYGNDIVILDTAGRLQIDEVLMQELVQIKEAVPVDETLLVVDAMAGQDAVNVAKTFNETVGIDGIILTKTDGDTRGGAALSVLSVTGKPIKFQGTGEKLDDLDVFHPDRMARRILGMGNHGNPFSCILLLYKFLRIVIGNKSCYQYRILRKRRSTYFFLISVFTCPDSDRFMNIDFCSQHIPSRKIQPEDGTYRSFRYHLKMRRINDVHCIFLLHSHPQQRILQLDSNSSQSERIRHT